MPQIIRSDATRLGIKNGTFSSSFSADKKGITAEVSLAIMVAGDDINTTDLEILATPGLPRLYQLFAGGRWVNSIKLTASYPGRHPDTEAPTYIWQVDVGLSNDLDLENLPPNQDPLQPVNPLLIPAQISSDSITQIMPFNNMDAEGKVISNYFGEQLAEEISNEVEIHTTSITRWEVWPFPFAKSQMFNNTCNLFTFHGLPPGTCLMKVRSQKAFYEGIPYARATYIIKVLIDEQDPSREDTWVDLVLPHTSNRYLATANDLSTERTISAAGFEGPFYLKQDGTLSGFVNDFNPSDALVQTLTFARKRKVDWNPLALPDR